MKKRLLLILQILVSITLLAWIFWKPGFRAQIKTLITDANPGWLAAGFLIAGVCSLIGVVRWNIFLRMLGIHLRGWDVLRLSFVGLFFNTFMVGAVGGDVVKVVWLVARGQRNSAALLSVLMDRMSGLPPLIVTSVFFILLRLDWLRQSPTVAHLTSAIFLYLAVVTILLTVTFLLSLSPLIHRLPANFPVRARLLEYNTVYCKFIQCWPQTLRASFLSLLILLGHFFTFYCAARAFALDLPLLDFFAIMPAVDIIAALPVSLGGFGVREQLFVTLLGDLASTPAAQAVSVSLGGAFLSLVWGLAGLVLLPSYRRSISAKQP